METRNVSPSLPPMYLIVTKGYFVRVVVFVPLRMSVGEQDVLSPAVNPPLLRRSSIVRAAHTIVDVVILVRVVLETAVPLGVARQNESGGESDRLAVDRTKTAQGYKRGPSAVEVCEER